MYNLAAKTKSKRRNIYYAKIIQNWQLYLLILPPLLYILLFKYYPMYGVQIAFKDFVATKGIWGSPWVGFKHFNRFFRSYDFLRLIGNTLGISIYSLLAGFPFPIILALSMNYLKNKYIKKTVQLVTYAPHFVSTVVIVGILMQMLSPFNGILTNLIEMLTGHRVNFMANPSYFKSIYVWSGIWQNAGFGSIIYMATLAGIDPSLHEAAIVDGASRLRRIWHIDIPGLMPTAVIQLILSMSGILEVGFEKVLLMQNSLNVRASEVIDTFVYKTGLASATGSFSYPSAVGLFQNVIGLVMLIIANSIAKKVSETSLW